MGNSASSSRSHQDDTVDYGSLNPHGVYTGPRDWNHQIVTQLIVERRLAPFYRPLEDYDESWDDGQIFAARKEFPEQDVAIAESNSRTEAGFNSVSSPSSVHSSHAARRSSSLKEPCRLPEIMVYRQAVECPICFLYYPPNINRSRCCDQAICTECFVQIKRAEPTTTHVVSEPAACPFCVQDNFGVTYTPPLWRAGIGADNHHQQIYSSTARTTSNQSSDSASTRNNGKRKSLSPDNPDVVTIDQIRPDWEAKLAAVRAAVARRANRRIIMRQVGDRLIPVGITSGRIHTLPGDLILSSGEQAEDQPNNEGETRLNRRLRRRQQQQVQDLNQLLGTMGLGGQDLEEFMVMEAMRLSLLEHEEQQHKEAEKKRKEEQGRAARQGSQSASASSAASESLASTLASRSELPPIPSSSSIDDSLSSESNLTYSKSGRDASQASLAASGSATLRLEDATVMGEFENRRSASSRSATPTGQLPASDMFVNGLNKDSLSTEEPLLESGRSATEEFVHNELQKLGGFNTMGSKGDETSDLSVASTSHPQEG